MFDIYLRIILSYTPYCIYVLTLYKASDGIMHLGTKMQTQITHFIYNIP